MRTHGREGVVVLTATDVDELLGAEEAIEAVEEAFRLWSLGAAPPPGVLGVHVPGGGFHIKAAVMKGERDYFAAKTNGNFPGNPARHGLPSIQGVLVLADATVGTPLAVMDSIRITELRTAAATAVAARRLARPDASVLTLVGCGAQASSQLRAVAAVRSLAAVHVLDVDRQKAERFAAEAHRRLGIPVSASTDLRRSVQASDLCITCTTARTPFLEADMVRPGSLVAAVGADNEEKHEIHPELMRASRVVVDSLAQCRLIGDLHHALEAGAMSERDVHAELGDVLAGKREGRTSDQEIFVFDSTGTAIQDVACAAVVFERAMARGRGMSVGMA